MIDEDVYEQIYAVVLEIPKGKVVTYGQIATLIGRERNARLVGRALKFSHLFGNFPCHRVVGANGRLTADWEEQVSLLMKEGIQLKANGTVDLKLYGWHIND